MDPFSQKILLPGHSSLMLLILMEGTKLLSPSYPRPYLALIMESTMDAQNPAALSFFDCFHTRGPSGPCFLLHLSTSSFDMNSPGPKRNIQCLLALGLNLNLNQPTEPMEPISTTSKTYPRTCQPNSGVDYLTCHHDFGASKPIGL